MDRENLSLTLTVLGKLLYTYPDEGFLKSVKDAGLFDDMPYEVDSGGFREGLALLRAWQSSGGDYAGCISDYQDLFVGVRGQVKAPAWESVYLSPEPVMFTVNTLKVRQWYDKYGIAIKNITHEPDDHMGVELMFIGYLLREHPDDAYRFMAEHTGLWYEKFFHKVAVNASSPLYKGLALMSSAVCGELMGEKQRFAASHAEAAG